MSATKKTSLCARTRMLVTELFSYSDGLIVRAIKDYSLDNGCTY